MTRLSRTAVFGVLFAATGCLAGCMSVQSTSFPTGSPRPPKALDAAVLVFREKTPDRPFEVVARLNVHIEKTAFIPTVFSEALPKLEILARERGADAIVEIAERKSRLNETFIYNVTANAIVFTDTPPRLGNAVRQ